MRFKFLAGLAASALLVSPAFADELTGKATIVNTSNQAVGEAQFRQGGKGVLISIQLHEMPPGPHGLHIHALGTCEDPAAGFKAAGDHTKNHTKNAMHGLLNDAGPENGDLPNIYVGNDGTAQAEFYSTMVSLNVQKGRDNLIDKDGSALVIHASTDDHMAQPIGNSGDRIACGVITSAATADQIQPQPGPPGPPLTTLTPSNESAAPQAGTESADAPATAAPEPSASPATAAPVPAEQTAPAPDAPASTTPRDKLPAPDAKTEPHFTGSLGHN